MKAGITRKELNSLLLKPYYQTKLGKLYYGDCLEIIPQLEPVDLVLTDPPYGENAPQKANRFGTSPDSSRKSTNDDWDVNPFSVDQAKAFMDISKNQIVFGANHCWEAFYSTRCYIVWDKRGNLPSVPFADTEFAWTSFSNRMSRKYTVINHGFIRDCKERRIHPTQKPLSLFIQILEDFSKDGQLILDPFLGSGTTAVACEQLNRRWVGIEINKGYCDNIINRIVNESKSISMRLSNRKTKSSMKKLRKE